MNHLPNSYWLRHMLEQLVMQIIDNEKSGLLTNDAVSIALSLRAYLEQYDRSNSALDAIQPQTHRSVPVEPRPRDQVDRWVEGIAANAVPPPTEETQ